MGGAKRYPSSTASSRDGTRSAPPILRRVSTSGLRRAIARDVRRGAYDLRAAIGVGRVSLGQAPHRFQNQKVLFGEHGVSSSAMASPLVWQNSGGSTQPAMLPDFDFRKLSAFSKNGFVSRAECFIAAPCTKPRWPNHKRHPRTGHTSLSPAGCSHAMVLRLRVLPEGLPSASAVSGLSRRRPRND